MFLSAAHSDADVDETLNVFNDAVRVTLSKIAPLP
jgi:hypothetical protein